jgi:hypothetical protein
LPRTDGDVVVDPGLLGQVDEDHHSRQQADRVEVDRLDRLLLVEAGDEQDHHRGRDERHLGPMNALRRDQRERGDEGDHGEGHGLRAYAGAGRCVH